MKTTIYKSNSRGYANHGWLKSHHTFSFAGYQDPNRMNFGMLRVLNDDIVQPKMGFGTHPHQNMEIVSIPLKGALSHKDSMGNKRAIEVDEVQVMSAGTGLTHSEFNDSSSEEVNFLQLWIIPEEMSIAPNYEQKKFNKEERLNTLQTVVAPFNSNLKEALPIHQQAYIYRSTLNKDASLNLVPKDKANGFYIFNIEGSIEVEDQILESRDAIGIEDIEEITLTSKDKTELVIIEVPMN